MLLYLKWLVILFKSYTTKWRVWPLCDWKSLQIIYILWECFRTEYGSPITSHSFREVLARVETDLIKNCEDRYGFKWTKHVTPHSFRHMHITYLQSEGMKVAIKEIMERVGHANYETTMLYTHSQGISQNQTIKALDKFIDRNNFRFEALKSWSSKYSKNIKWWNRK